MLMRKYRVTITRTRIEEAEIEVEAPDRHEADRIAHDEVAGETVVFNEACTPTVYCFVSEPLP